MPQAGGPVRPADAGQLLTVDQAAEYFGTGQRFVRRLISERRIPYVKLGKHVRLERSALDACIAAGRVADRWSQAAVHRLIAPPAQEPQGPSHASKQQTAIRPSSQAALRPVAGPLPRPGRGGPERSEHVGDQD